MGFDKNLLPVKAHFFFFMAASGPILPYLTVYGKELGISEVAMGIITATVPITFLLAKPAFGFVVDYFYGRRKFIFMSLIAAMSAFYLGLYFVPPVNINLQYYEFDGNASGIEFSGENATAGTVDDSSESFGGKLCNGSRDCETISSDERQISNVDLGRNATKCEKKCIIRSDRLFRSAQFYGFVILITLSMIAFNVGNSISDAICFDMLGEGRQKKYGYQRVWGTIGFGITAFLGGAGMDLWSNGNVKNYNPAFFIIIVCTTIDMICCLKLKLPKMQTSENIIKDLSKVLKNKSIAVFLVFVTLVGVLDGFIIYFMFWFLEDLAIEADQMKHIKVLEGLTVAAETLGGEIIFFVLSGKIIKKLGYGHTLSICFFNYALRLCLISLIADPWWIIAVELLMQGSTYALCYTTIVAYASAISPPGTSATMQGIIAGMDDGFGYSLGSLIGGILYKNVGGRSTFQLFSLLALLCCISHAILYKALLSKSYKRGEPNEYKSPEEAIRMTQTNSDGIPTGSR